MTCGRISPHVFSLSPASRRAFDPPRAACDDNALAVRAAACAARGGGLEREHKAGHWMDRRRSRSRLRAFGGAAGYGERVGARLVVCASWVSNRADSAEQWVIGGGSATPRGSPGGFPSPSTEEHRVGAPMARCCFPPASPGCVDAGVTYTASVCFRLRSRAARGLGNGLFVRMALVCRTPTQRESIRTARWTGDHFRQMRHPARTAVMRARYRPERPCRGRRMGEFLWTGDGHERTKIERSTSRARSHNGVRQSNAPITPSS